MLKLSRWACLPIEESLNIGRDAVKIAKDLGLKVMVLGSTDLTHYGANYGFRFSRNRSSGRKVG